MIASVLSRHTAIRDEAEWDKRAPRLLERITPLLERQPGFEGIELRREAPGQLSETTRWASRGDCDAYVRGGSAAMVATIADAFLPTAPYPNGNWHRVTREA